MDFPRTLTGLCAMGVVSKYNKPTMVGRTNSEGYFKGSIRAPSNIEGMPSFMNFLNDSGYMDFVAGHPNSAGFSIKTNNVSKLIDYANKKLSNVDFNENCWPVDFVVNGNCSYLNDMIEELVNGEQFWGQECPEPMIAIENISLDTKNISYKGEQKNTVAFKVNGIEYIKFKDSNLVKQFAKYAGKTVNIVVIGTPQINEWMGRKTSQIMIKEIEIKESSEFDF